LRFKKIQERLFLLAFLTPSCSSGCPSEIKFGLFLAKEKLLKVPWGYLGMTSEKQTIFVIKYGKGGLWN
jgi:hypothetical protein